MTTAATSVERLPISPAQRCLWLANLMKPGSVLDPSCVVWRVNEISGGEPDLAALATALDEVVARHEALRVAVDEAGGEPFQVVLPPRPAEVRSRRVPAADPGDEQVRRAIMEEATRPFDMAGGPLLRASWLRLGPGRGVLVLAMHHWAADARALELLEREVSAAYRAVRAGDRPALRPLRRSYADVMRARREVDPATAAAEADFWNRELDGARRAAVAPTRRPGRRTGRASTVARPVRGEDAAGVTLLAGQSRATPYMVLLAAAGALLSGGGGDVTVFGVHANRTRDDIGLIGFFAEPLPLRLRLDPSGTFADAVAATRDTCLRAFSHRKVAFLDLLERLPRVATALMGGNEPATVFQSFATDATLDLDGLRSAPLETVGGGDGSTDLVLPVDLDITVEQLPGRFCLEAFYATDLWDAGDVADVADRLRRLVTAALAAPDRSVADLVAEAA